MSIRKKRRLTAEINVVPYIDVMLVLLIIFMVTAPLLTTGVDVNLPKAQAKAVDFGPKNQPIVLTIQKDGEMSLNVGQHPDQTLPPAAVRRIVSKIISSRPDAPVAVKADGAGTYANVVQGMVLLQQAGAKQVGLITQNVNKASDKGNR